MNVTIFDLVDYLRKKSEVYDLTIRKKYNLNESDYFFFIALKKCDCINSCIMAKGMGISQSRVSRIIESLVKKGLLLRTTDDKDRRSIKIKLTPSGAQLLKKINTARSNDESMLFQQLDEASVNTIKQTVQKLIDLL